MAMTLYDLAGADPDLRFSPYCWRAKLALAHKELEFETVPWFFTEGEKIAFSGQSKVPVLIDGERTLTDSWAIAAYLEERYPDRPSLFGGVVGQAHARFVNGWADTVLLPSIARLVVRDVLDVLRPQDQTYFRTTRERTFGKPLEQVIEGREHRVEDFRRGLSPVRTVLKHQPWLGGETASYADYIVLGSLMWPHCCSKFPLIESDDPVFAWRARGLALFGGLAERALTRP